MVLKRRRMAPVRTKRPHQREHHDGRGEDDAKRANRVVRVLSERDDRAEARVVLGGTGGSSLWKQSRTARRCARPPRVVAAGSTRTDPCSQLCDSHFPLLRGDPPTRSSLSSARRLRRTGLPHSSPPALTRAAWRPRVDPAFHLLEPGRATVQAPGPAKLHAQRIPQGRLQQRRHRPATRALQDDAQQERVVVVVQPAAARVFDDDGAVQSRPGLSSSSRGNLSGLS